MFCPCVLFVFYYVIVNYYICVGSCLTIIFTFRYGIVHFKCLTVDIFCEWN